MAKLLEISAQLDLQLHPPQGSDPKEQFEHQDNSPEPMQLWLAHQVRFLFATPCLLKSKSLDTTRRRCCILAGLCSACHITL